MHLRDFESEIDWLIVERGQDYYLDGRVELMVTAEDRVYSATVEGTELYNVDVELDKQSNIIETSCDCPYDWGPYCKHQVAVFLAIRDEMNPETAPKIVKKTCDLSRTTQKCDLPENHEGLPPIKNLLELQSKEALIAFLCRLAESDEDVTAQIERVFDTQSDEDELAKARRVIKAAIYGASDRGFVDYRRTAMAVSGAEQVLEIARTSLAENRINQAVRLCLCTLTEMIDLLQSADDSDGTIGGIISECLGFFDDVGEDNRLTPVIAVELLGLMLTESRHPRFYDWPDMRLDLIEKCLQFICSPDMKNQFELHLDHLLLSNKTDTWTFGYLSDRVGMIRYHLIEQYDGPEAAFEYAEQHLENSDFREMAIQHALRQRDYTRVIGLVEEGVINDKNLPGLVYKWLEYQYEAYRLSGNIEAQRRLALDFVVDGREEYYHALKGTYPPERWAPVYSGILASLANKLNCATLYTKILIEEKELPLLLEYVKRNISEVGHLYKHLVPQYAGEVWLIFEKHILQIAESAHDRKSYQYVCGKIETLVKAGGMKKAEDIRNLLLEKYARKPAFRDELARVRLAGRVK